MERYYFTFGSWEKFPFQNTYLIVLAKDRKDAVETFRKKYPDETEGCVNCSSIYTEREWRTEIERYYENKSHADMLWSKAFGNIPDGFDDVFIYVPGVKEIIRIAEGDGFNLLPEDEELGCVDYIYYNQYELDSMAEIDGGMITLTQLCREKYKRLADAIPDVLDMAYYNAESDFIILK